jgi:hypothetical protein
MCLTPGGLFYPRSCANQTPNQARSPVHVGGLSPRLVKSAFKRTKWHFAFFEEMESEDADCQLLDAAVSR